MAPYRSCPGGAALVRSCEGQGYPFLAGALILIVIILPYMGCGIIHWTWRDSSCNEKNNLNLNLMLDIFGVSNEADSYIIHHFSGWAGFCSVGLHSKR